MYSNEPARIATLSDRSHRSSRDELVPDIVVPQQWSWGRASFATALPEARLMLSILDDAVFRFLTLRDSKTARAVREWQEIEEWFASTDSSWLYSFENICSMFDLEADTVRSMLAMWKAAPPEQRGKRRRRQRHQAAPTRTLGSSGMRHVA